MKDKLDELENKKTLLEQEFDKKKEQLQQLESDIMLMQQLITAKREHGKLLSELNEIVEEHKRIVEEIGKATPADEKINQ